MSAGSVSRTSQQSKSSIEEGREAVTFSTELFHCLLLFLLNGVAIMVTRCRSSSTVRRTGVDITGQSLTRHYCVQALTSKGSTRSQKSTRVRLSALARSIV